ncbi:hypothetical protein ACN27F_07120 [Solwaraspora sp. WMMB335]|uniref:hypothetical protein n=1 Tax=Solwaraspora sp. WMMB335 TaxID=3404118 RepID=UPI003B96768E
MTVLLVLLIGAVTAALVAAIWAMSAADTRREHSARRNVAIEIQQWAAGRGWATGPAPAGYGDRTRSEQAGSTQCVISAHGEHAGHPAAVLIYEEHSADAGLPTVTFLVRSPVPVGDFEIRYATAGRVRPARNPPLPDQAPRDIDFDRKLKVAPSSRQSASQLLVAPVRAALLRLDRIVTNHGSLVRGRAGVLQAATAGWPPAVDLDRTLTALTDLAEALPQPGPVH